MRRPSEGSIRALQAAALAFLTLLAVGSLLVIAVKVQYPSFGTGANPVEILTTLVIAALGVMRVPVHVGDLTLTVLPLGALILAGTGIVWATRSAGIYESKVAPQLGLAFGAISCVAALVFRHRFDVDPVYAGAIGALVWGTVWAALFAWVAVTLRRETPLRLGPEPSVAGVALGLSAVLSTLALLLWIVVGLIRDVLPRSFGGGEAVASAIYLVTFGPNLVLAVIALALGTPLHAGAQVRLDGNAVGRVQTYSLWSWAGERPEPLLYVLLLIPLVATVAAGIYAHRRVPSKAGTRWWWLWRPAALVGLVLGLLCWIAEARLGAGLLASRGFAQLGAAPLLVAPAAFAWMMIGGAAGWFWEERRGT